jgi:hypothetical protein
LSIGTAVHGYTILGTVKLEKNWFGILGFSISKPGIDACIYQAGGVVYADLLEEARRSIAAGQNIPDLLGEVIFALYFYLFIPRTNIIPFSTFSIVSRLNFDIRSINFCLSNA